MGLFSFNTPPLLTYKVTQGHVSLPALNARQKETYLTTKQAAEMLGYAKKYLIRTYPAEEISCTYTFMAKRNDLENLILFL